MNESTIGCALRLPYPPTETQGKNLYYAALLTNDYAGIVSEMSAVTTYAFQQLVTPNKKIHDVLACISAVEMRHLGLIGGLIEAFGGKPRFAVHMGGKCSFWNAQSISYEANPRCYLKENIANERAAITNYRTRIRQIADSKAQALLSRIILDEELHIGLFAALLEEFY
jgi:bacterioferritin